MLCVTRHNKGPSRAKLGLGNIMFARVFFYKDYRAQEWRVKTDIDLGMYERSVIKEKKKGRETEVGERKSNVSAVPYITSLS